jgi:DNA-binding response OmpR family regulator
MTKIKPFKVFVMEDDRALINVIEKELSKENYHLHFFSKDDSVFDLLNFHPDILIQDYSTNKVTKCHEWSMPY